MRLTTTFALLLVAGCFAHANAGVPTFTEIIETQGKCVFTDGSSTYQFYKDGTFMLEPNDKFSGRTVHGAWNTTDNRKVVITGKWGLINGISKDDDYRELTLLVTLRSDQPAGAESLGPVKRFKVYPVYFTVEGLRPIGKQEYEKAMTSRTKPTVP
jgi:hypothetical protein